MRTPERHKVKKNRNSEITYTVIAFAIIVGGTYFYINSGKIAPQHPAAQLTPISLPTTAPVNEQQATDTIDKEVTTADTTIEPAETLAPTGEVEASNLSSLNDSDATVLSSAQSVSLLPSYTVLLKQTNIIRNLVVFIDNLSRGELLTKYSPLIKPTEPFSVLKVDNEIYLDTKSYHRYDLYVDIINAINIDYAIDQYRLLTPLFSEAYAELGYSENAFISTLSAAIEGVLNAPIIREPIKLVAPSVMYKFADPQLEALSSADKLMIRMGPDNMLKLRVKLQKIQIALKSLSEQ
ncbi:DUF3014 domain-containing protein [Psychromonas antarctica]|jgi:hypothetical protein|uniref:DUF3014 domain-containing protein n=1 Tax=Psychromonas antarctica TaxID=67573 RepID=UPI001EE82B66|nr:DUF3014 domain-containing protein [Psychromonas antarctica]MCG6201271.1 DUF3014 domain-containing protein [Psychromonas antarctica]